MEHEQSTYFGLHFEARERSSTSDTLPAQNLMQALEGLQRTIHLVAMMREGREIKTRARVTRDIEERFQLQCRIPQKGSFYQPTYIAERDQSLLGPSEVEEVAQITKELLRSVSSRREMEFKRTVPDSAFRAPILASLGKMFDGQVGQYMLSVEESNGQAIVESFSAVAALQDFRRSRLEPGTHSIVTGFFNRIDFKERKLSLLIPNSSRSVSCIYEEDIEAELLENARDLIQVVGTIELDDDGNPRRITDVQEVHPVNTDDIDVIELLPKYLKANHLNNLHIHVELSDDKQTYLASMDALGIQQAAYTRDDLIDALEGEIDFLWRNIAQEDDVNLAPKALELKRELHRLFKEF